MVGIIYYPLSDCGLASGILLIQDTTPPSCLILGSNQAEHMETAHIEHLLLMSKVLPILDKVPQFASKEILDRIVTPSIPHVYQMYPHKCWFRKKCFHFNLFYRVSTSKGISPYDWHTQSTASTTKACYQYDIGFYRIRSPSSSKFSVRKRHTSAGFL